MNIFGLALGLLCLFVTSSHAVDIRVAWDVPVGRVPTNYLLYTGTSPGVYGAGVNVGTTIPRIVTGLAIGTTYYMAVSAVYPNGESTKTAEITVKIAHRYTSPTGTGTTCSTGVPCDLDTAMKQANPGESVILKDGIYESSAMVDVGSIYTRYVSMPRTYRSGKPGLPITIVAENALQAILKPPLPAAHQARIVDIVHDWITLRGIVVDGRLYYHELLQIIGGTASDGGVAAGEAIVDNVTVEECQFINGGGRGFTIWSASDTLFRHNLIDNLGWFSSDPSTGDGMIGGGTPGLPSVNFTMYGNTIRNATSNMMFLYDASLDNAIIHHNIFENLMWPTQGGRQAAHACSLTPGCPVPVAGHGYNNGMVIFRSKNSAMTYNIFRNNEAGDALVKLKPNANNTFNSNVTYATINTAQYVADDTGGALGLTASEITNNTLCTVSSYIDGVTTGLNIHANFPAALLEECTFQASCIVTAMAALPRFTPLATIDPPTGLTVEGIFP